MNEFFHVSRSDLSGISQFNLKHFQGYIEAEMFYTAQEFTDLKLRSYPNGISKHGELYLHHPFKAEGPDLAFTRNELVLETTLELIRQMKFRNRKSRFEITFGCLSLEDAIKLKTEYFNGNGEIYKVNCENYSLADMNLVRQAGSIIGLQILAEKYWNGELSATPFQEVLMENPVTILETVT